ncbi:hypothetical protein AJ79_03374 [Helicocarpus griseus UAMH5409]|uniref:Spindle pole body-associated protein cut12 domain-containing protein n=1 Tax=Helicocarpus griseus UAMH5409 TaxID=1447875 RepID=A0A2B7XYF7_9EURO|nr:hypothetical protein AJ79_03374 [Helicocarpus griseus UAMH5409]
MLGWLAGSGRGDYTGFADESKAQEAPETPAPVFAFRAFKSAFIGTPGPDATDDELTVPIKPLKVNVNRKSLDIIPAKHEKPASVNLQPSLPKPDESAQPMASPTKSILLTPGTAATRRKTVSFGEGVVDNERKKSPFESTAYNGNISRQWTGKQLDGNGKSRSKLTQSLMEARERKSDSEQKVNEDDALFDIVDRKDRPRVQEIPQPSRREQTEEVDEDDKDVTTNLEDPRSQSGIYWKAEFDNYRAKTDREMKKLIQYRSVIKSYAKKKDTEMQRLSEKLKREEAKVAEMELHVSKLAAGMVDRTGNKESNEDMVKELATQTALAVQNKRKAESLRKALERHGVLESDEESQEKDSGSEHICQKLRETEEALALANAKLKDAESNKPDVKQFQDLIESSARKANELQKENKDLKQQLARVKQEMTNYGGRRDAKEARLKQKEQKLQNRVQEYRNRLEEARQQHQDAEELLKQSFADEKRHMQEIIDSLRQNISTAGQPHNVARRNGEYKVSPTQMEIKREPRLEHARDAKYSPQKTTAIGRITQTHEDGMYESPKKDNNRNERLSRRDKPRDVIDGQVDGMEPELRTTKRDLTQTERAAPDKAGVLIDFSEDDDGPLTDLEDLHGAPKSRFTGALPYRNGSFIPPSSPPALPSVEISPAFSAQKPKTTLHLQDRSALSPRPSMARLSSKPSGRLSSEYQQHLRHKVSATSLIPKNASSKIATTTKPSDLNRHIRSVDESNIPNGSDAAPSPATVKRDALPADRAAAARRRLKLRGQEKKMNAEGKENVWSI